MLLLEGGGMGRRRPRKQQRKLVFRSDRRKCPTQIEEMRGFKEDIPVGKIVGSVSFRKVNTERLLPR